MLLLLVVLPVELVLIDSVECADAVVLFCDDDRVLQLFKLVEELLYTVC